MEKPASTPVPERAATVPAARTERYASVVREISRFVEGSRGLKFKRTVRVAFLGDAAFNKRMAESDEPAPDEFAVARTLGLVDPALPAAATGDATTADDNIVGFYDFEANELFVRGTKPTPYARYVLAHELTHALQDQHFNLNRIAKLGVQDETDTGLLTIAEGDAMRVADAYYSSLSPDEQKEIDAIEDPKPETTTTTTVPANAPIPWPGNRGGLYSEIFPYALGPTLVARLIDQGGQAALDFAFAHPVVTSEQLIFPKRGKANEQPVAVATPTADGPPIAEGPVGVMELNMLFFSQWVDVSWPAYAWGGGRYVAWGEGEAACVRFTVVMDTGYDAASLRTSLETIAEYHGQSTVTGPQMPKQWTITRDQMVNGPVTYTTCGPPKTRTWDQAQAVAAAAYNKNMAEIWRSGGYSGPSPRYTPQKYAPLPPVWWLASPE